MAGLTQRVEAILHGDAHDGLTYRLAGATETLAEVARNLPPPGANVRHEGGAARLDAVFEVVYVRGDPWVALPAARIARIPGGYPEGVLGRIDRELGSRLASAVTEASVLILYVDAERRARALVGLFTNKDQYYHGALALAVCADDASSVLAGVSVWNRTRVALVRAGHGLPAPEGPKPKKTEISLRKALSDAVAGASPLASVTRSAVAAQVLVLCAVACFGQRGLRCVLAALVSGMRAHVPSAVAEALGKVAATFADRFLPHDVRAMLVPSADVACAAASLTGLLAAAGLVPPVVAVAARAATECRPAPGALPYDAPCQLIAAACDATAMLVSSVPEAAKLPASGDLSEWSKWHAGDGPMPATGNAEEWGKAIVAHLARTEAMFIKRDLMRQVLKKMPADLPKPMHATLAKLVVCALVAASGAWPNTSLARGTMLSYLAWHNPALAAALHLCE